MARKTSLTTPTPFRAPRVPQAGKLRREFGTKGRELRPLAGPSIPMPPEEDEQVLARFASWKATYNGSLPEFIVWEWLVNKKKQRPGIDFIYQHPIFGGRTAFGGFVLDYFFPLQKMGWRVQGLRWHDTNPDDRARDQLAKMLLTSRGILVVDLYEDDLLMRPDLALNLAWQGQQANTARGI